MFVRRVSGESMQPALREGDFVMGWRRRVRVGDIVLVRRGDREVLKRVKSIKGSGVYLRGDNSLHSTDSRHYGEVPKSAIIGSIMTKFRFPKAVNPPKLVKPYGLWLGRGLAVFMVGMVLAHLYRIDTFIPLLDGVLPGGSGWATAAALLIVFSELFSIPFLLRMKLSPLAHIKSGALVVFAPLWWFLITIWAWGMTESTGQLGEFVYIEADPFVLLLNIVWLGISYVGLYAMGYNQLTLRSIFPKKR